MNFKEMKEYKSKIQFISKELNNYSLSIDIKLSEATDKKALYSKQSLKLFKMATIA